MARVSRSIVRRGVAGILRRVSSCSRGSDLFTRDRGSRRCSRNNRRRENSGCSSKASDHSSTRTLSRTPLSSNYLTRTKDSRSGRSSDSSVDGFHGRARVRSRRCPPVGRLHSKSRNGDSGALKLSVAPCPRQRWALFK